MKQGTEKARKELQPLNMKTAKPTCGTLSYMAECRGVMQKTGSIRWATPPDSIDKTVRK